LTIIFAVCAIFPVCATDILLFPKPAKTVSAETMPFSQTLHSGIENDTFYMRGRFGVDFPIVGYDFDQGGDDEGGNHRKILFGINAAAHINMIPTSNMRFPVDNLYAVLALNFSGNISEKWSWRFYPVYHVSAHLADGYPDNIMKSDVRAVSSEMTRGEVYYKPFGDILELGAGFGWYYHVCAQKDLLYRGDVSVLLTPGRYFYSPLLPYALLRAENVYQGKNNLGIDVSAGVLSIKNNRGFGLSLRYFNRLHSSYYFERYEKGWGVEYTFLY